MSEWIKTMRYIRKKTKTKTKNRLLLSHKKKETLPFATACVSLEGVMLSEIG